MQYQREGRDSFQEFKAQRREGKEGQREAQRKGGEREKEGKYLHDIRYKGFLGPCEKIASKNILVNNLYNRTHLHKHIR